MDFGGGFLESWLGDVEHEDAGAFTHEQDGGFEADAAGGAGDGGDFVGKAVDHGGEFVVVELWRFRLTVVVFTEEMGVKEM